jgi:hypothetical protein
VNSVRNRPVTPRERLAAHIRYRSVYIAGLLALFLVFAVQTGTRYLLNDWTRERLERFMSANLHRKVEMGRATWSVGLTGLIISVQDILITDRDRTSPFITSRNAEIGIPLIPMLAGQLELRHVSFANPEVWAVKLPNGQWNFSDLPQIEALKNIALIDMTGGQLNVVDESVGSRFSWTPFTVSNARFHLERPFQNQTWPFSLHFEVPHPKFTSTVDISGIGNGNIDKWYENNHQFNLTARKLSLVELRRYVPTLPEFNGVVDLDVTGQGIPQSDFEVDATARTPTMDVFAPGIGWLNVKNGVVSGHFAGGRDRFIWTNTVVHLGGFDMQSEGKVLGLNTKQPTYNAQLSANVTDLNKLATFLPAVLLPEAMNRRIAADRFHLISIANALAPARLSGSGVLKARVDGVGDHPHVWSHLQVANVSMQKLDPLRPFREFPILGLISANPSAVLNAELTLIPNGRSTIDSGNIKIDHSNILLSGFMYLDKSEAHISYYSKGLDLAGVAPATESRPNRRLNQILGLPPNSPVAMQGGLDVNGVIIARGNNSEAHSLLTLENARVSFARDRLVASHLNGQVLVDGNDIWLRNISGQMQNSPFTLIGRVPAQRTGPIDLQATAKTVDLSAVQTAAAALGLQYKSLTLHDLAGNLDNLQLLVRGTLASPNVDMSAHMRNVVFQPTGQRGTARIASGELRVANNTAYLTRAIGTLGRGSFGLVATLSPTTTQFTFSGQNIDISEFRQALADLGAKSSFVRERQTLFGTIASGVLQFSQAGEKSSFRLTASPRAVYYQPNAHAPRAFLLTGGTLFVGDGASSFNKVRGTLGDGTFILTGNLPSGNRAPANLSFVGKHLDLSNIKVALKQLNVKSPLLAQRLLYGKVKLLVFDMKGTKANPIISMTATPEAIRFEPYGTKRSLYLAGGVVKYKDDVLTLDKVSIINQRSTALVSLRMGNLSHGSHLDELHLSTRSFDLGDLSTYLSAPRTPPMLRDSYKSFLALYGISKPFGVLVGTLDFKRGGGAGSFNADMALRNAGFQIKQFQVSDVNGRLATAAGTLQFTNVSGKVGRSPFVLNGAIAKFLSPNRAWQATVQAKLNARDLQQILQPGFTTLATDTTIPVTLTITGSGLSTAISFSPIDLTQVSTLIAPDAAPGSIWKQLQGTLAGTITLSGGQQEFTANVRLGSFTLGKLVFSNIRGKVVTATEHGVTTYRLEDATANTTGGIVRLSGTVEAAGKRRFNLDIAASNIDVNCLLTALASAPGEITGRLAITASVAGEAAGRCELLRSLYGCGAFSMTNGRVKRLGQLQGALTKLNLLKEGIAGFNINNLVAAITPIKSNRYCRFDGRFDIGNGTLGLCQLSYNGEELRLRAAGSLQLLTGQARIAVAGNIPRISHVGLKGPTAQLLEKLSINGAIKAVAGNALEHLPELPIIGDIGHSKPRAFEFVASGNLRDGDQITKSIMQSFHWLPNVRNATPHPVYGLGYKVECGVE